MGDEKKEKTELEEHMEEEKWKLVKEERFENDRIVGQLESQKKVAIIKIKEEEKISKTNKEVTTDAVEIDFGKTITIENGEVLQDGKKINLSVDNGLEGKTFAAVTGVRAKEIYEKVVSKTEAVVSIVLVGAILLGIPVLFDACKNRRIPDGDEHPIETPAETKTEEEKEEEKQQAIEVIFYDSFDKINGALDFATMVRALQDAAMAVDYDMRLLGSFLCDYREIAEKILEPGARDIAQQQDFEDKYKEGTKTPEDYITMVKEGKELLKKYKKTVESHIRVNDEHIKTTQEVLDRGLRGESYENELSCLKEISAESQEKINKCDGIERDLEKNAKIVQGIMDGTIRVEIINGEYGQHINLYNKKTNDPIASYAGALQSTNSNTNGMGSK